MKTIRPRTLYRPPHDYSITSVYSSSSSKASTTEMASVVCPHCGHLLSKKTYLSHKRLYYDEEGDAWIKKQKLDANGELNFGQFAQY